MSESYECDLCGACCKTKLVDVHEVDLLREPRLATQMLRLKEPGLDGEIGYLGCRPDGSCSFLEGDNRCSIYATRPSVCVLFAAGSDECQEARKAIGLPLLEPKVCGPDD
jgi:Fe-S-cluster containining protein